MSLYSTSLTTLSLSYLIIGNSVILYVYSDNCKGHRVSGVDILTSKIQFEGDVLSYKQVFAELMTISHDRL